ncbi:uncharacterized protein [Parasteatoda tepidariorum]|uniref:uncharacterized protein n=1 Tax=Parasteatoda tepidariorum TaxID=114398 RepID=UPI00077FBF36|nr:uncharacterized protein LOC107439199 [Parasteatoda tepidariorum]
MFTRFFWGVLLFSTITCGVSFEETVPDDDYDEGIILQVFHSDMSDDNWTSSPDIWDKKSPPLSMVIWISVVLGIFVFMVIAVCFALFCKYSGMLSSNREVEIRCPIPIIITPPSRRQTLASGEQNPELGFSNHGYYGVFENSTPESPTRELPPQYVDVHVNNTTYSHVSVNGKSETPPPEYMTVAPFK